MGFEEMAGLENDLVDAVLERFGFRDRPEPTYAGLEAVYGAWCEHVPFDNLVKRIHLAGGSAAPFPNREAVAFLDLYLRHGAGGTCWPSTLGLHALLVELGFDARLGSASMRDNLAGRIHTHGTIIVRDQAKEYWVDTSMLTERPVPIERGGQTRLDHPFRPVRVEPVDDLWRVYWSGQTIAEEIPCLLLDDDVSIVHCQARYEASREMSPFNTRLHATTMRGGRCLTISKGERWERDATDVRHAPVEGDRDRVLVEEFGYSEAIVGQLPPDEP
ncbi:MAG: N-hydroxyarylamine O-acetyltransferase [Actinomycetota bacterium]|jgi:N-hydroxyarylamine O-acetyltransferase|nr:N-hydroxyarylamine O-acetyltransferase [Actinomycetota bacterium]